MGLVFKLRMVFFYTTTQDSLKFIKILGQFYSRLNILSQIIKLFVTLKPTLLKTFIFIDFEKCFKDFKGLKKQNNSRQLKVTHDIFLLKELKYCKSIFY